MLGTVTLAKTPWLESLQALGGVWVGGNECSTIILLK